METPVPEYEIRAALITVPDVRAFLNTLRTVMQAHHTTIVCFNAGNMAGMRHADAAFAHAIRSFRAGSPIAKTLEMEALLYAAGTRQCADAAAFGIHEGVNRVYVCCCPRCPAIWDVLAPLMSFVEETFGLSDPSRVQQLKRLYSITDAEITAAGGPSRLQDLVIERVALLDAYR